VNKTGPVPLIIPGKRLAVVGRTGSGKTYLERWFMLRSGLRWVVLDTKHDPGFNDWRPSGGLLEPKALKRRWADTPYIVVRPHPVQNNPATLDYYLGQLHDAFEGFGVCVDETYQVVTGPRPGPGLTGLVTRGRVRRQAVILGSQRPSWVPRFMFSEADYVAAMSLTLLADRQRVFEFTGDQRSLLRLAPREWLWYDVAANHMTLYAPVLIAP
jgi:hypothetical protein